jgi:hypothetical protein
MSQLVKQVRNIFIDSETNKTNDETQVQVNLVPSDFWCGPDENMRMTLTTFEMRTNWYNINQYNNVFFIWAPTAPSTTIGIYYPVTILAKTYYDFLDTIYNPNVAAPVTAEGLENAITTALAGAGIGTGHTCVYNVNTRLFTITLSYATSGGLLDALSFPVSFQVPPTQGAPPVGVTFQQFFVDTSEILGGIATKVAPSAILAPVSLMVLDSSPVGFSVFKSYYPAQLNSMEALYLRSNLQSANYATYGFAQSIYQNMVNQTTTFARIPLVNQAYEILNPFIFFEDTFGLFTIEIGNKQLDQVTFFLTDDKNRFIPLTAAGQVTNGSMSFKLTIKWEVVVRDSANPFIPTIQNVKNRLIAFPNNYKL